MRLVYGLSRTPPSLVVSPMSTGEEAIRCSRPSTFLVFPGMDTNEQVLVGKRRGEVVTAVDDDARESSTTIRKSRRMLLRVGESFFVFQFFLFDQQRTN